MNTIQKEIIESLGVSPTIDKETEVRKRIDFLKSYAQKSKTNGFVLGISGGQDSTLAGKLTQLAVNELKEEGYNSTFIAIRIPHGIQKDEKDAKLALNFIQPNEIVNFNIYQTVENFAKDFSTSTNEPLSDFHKGNVKARTRMMVQYALAGERNLLVVGTDHASEAITGFFTKFGDGASDLLPLSGLTKRQGTILLKYLDSPEELYLKTPTADLLDNQPLQSDEQELGITYNEIDDYLEGKFICNEISLKIEKRFFSSQHKRHLPISLLDNWWEK